MNFDIFKIYLDGYLLKIILIKIIVNIKLNL